ncbi:MAG: replicative DNA helicase [Bacteroidetes bacterium]|nr:MAG: replicative DNA helicase [Bacteroidota bacterium]
MENTEKKQGTQARRTPKTISIAGLAQLSDHGRVPPQALDLEEAVLGAMMLEQNALTNVVDILKPEVFYKEAHQKVFKVIHTLFSDSQPVDILTVTQKLQQEGELESVGGAYYISQLTNRIASAANIEFHARIVLQKFLQRELIRISDIIIKESYEDSSDVFDILDKAEKELFALSETNLRRNYADMQSLVKQAIKQIENSRDQEGHISGVPSGFSAIDRVTAGWQKSDLIILAARPGMGKTAFVLTMARNIAVDFKKPVAIFSLEMAGVQLVTRLISSESELAADKLKRGQLEQYEWEQLNAKLGNLTDAPLYIDDTPALSIFELRAKCRRLKAQHDIQLVIVDYLQLMSGSTDKGGNREQEISNISRSMKSLSKELNIPIIALSQLSRAVETRGGSKKPILSDLRESGAIEQDADMVCFIYRPEYYKIHEDEQGNSTEGLAEFIIAKHRNGPQAEVSLRFVDKFAKFMDYETLDFDSGSDLRPSDSFDSPQNIVTLPSRMNDDDEDDVPF